MDETSDTGSAWLSQLRHDLRTPLNAIIGYSELLLEDEGGPTPEHMRADLRRVNECGRELLETITRMLAEDRLHHPGEDAARVVGRAVRHALRTPLNSIVGYVEMLLEEALDREMNGLLPDLERTRHAAERLLVLVELLSVSAPVTAPDDSAAKAAAGSRETMAEDHRRSAQPGRILVVDDDESNRDLLLRRLRKEGHEVQAASGGVEALELMRRRDFDLVLLDLMMPGLNGDEVLDRLKADFALRDVPVLMLSALDEMGGLARCIQKGAEDYLPKPANPIILRARIEACLEKKKLRDREIGYIRQIELERDRADELLHVILPEEIARELKTTHRVSPRRHDGVAILFADIVEFTPMCERLAPEVVIHMLQELATAFEEISAEHGLEKIKTIGDAFMAAGGLLKPLENPVLGSVRAGLAMVETARGLLGGGEVRVGIQFGPVVAGVVGKKTYLFDVWGDTVNTAARIEASAEPGTVNLGREAWHRVASVCHGQSRGMLDIKGKGQLELFRVQAVYPGA